MKIIRKHKKNKIILFIPIKKFIFSLLTNILKTLVNICHDNNN